MRSFSSRWLWLSLLLSPSLQAQDAFDLAQKAAEVIGIGRSGACSNCHATNSRQTLERWQNAVQKVDSCLNVDNSPTARERLACIVDQAVTDDWNPSPEQLGFYSAGVELSPLRDNLLEVFGEQNTASIVAHLKNTTIMPLRAPKGVSAEDFAAVRTWFSWGMPYLDELLTPYDGPSTCQVGLAPELKEHLRSIESTGWQKRNLDRGLLMFGCSPNGDHCFEQKRNGVAIFPDVKDLGAKQAWNPQPRFQLRKLYESSTATDYWIRSSADGRFIAYGSNPSGIIDLQAQLSGRDRVIRVNAYYDPGFFPDDSAFVFQGRGTAICNMSLLKNPSTTRINFQEDACSWNQQSQIPLYQSLGASLDGSDYLAATGVFMSDPGDGSGPVLDWAARSHITADPSSQLKLLPLAFDGSRWVTKTPQVFDTPWEIDWGLAPSNQLLASRLEGRIDGKLKHIGYPLYSIQRADGQSPYEKKSLGNICVDGVKANFSFDDRFFVTYSYIKAEQWRELGYASVDDPTFQERLQAGASNIFLYDLWTDKLTLITQTGPQQYALFPHFRSDGWMYFVIFDAKQGRRTYVASDAAVRIKAETPTR